MTGRSAGGVKDHDAGELTAKGRATRDRIGGGAADLMFGEGGAGRSLQDVQQASRVGGSQMYHYFGDKASLVHAVIARQGEDLLGKQQPWLARIDSMAGIPAWRGYVGRKM